VGKGVPGKIPGGVRKPKLPRMGWGGVLGYLCASRWQRSQSVTRFSRRSSPRTPLMWWTSRCSRAPQRRQRSRSRRRAARRARRHWGVSALRPVTSVRRRRAFSNSLSCRAHLEPSVRFGQPGVRHGRSGRRIAGGSCARASHGLQLVDAVHDDGDDDRDVAQHGCRECGTGVHAPRLPVLALGHRDGDGDRREPHDAEGEEHPVVGVHQPTTSASSIGCRSGSPRASSNSAFSVRRWSSASPSRVRAIGVSANCSARRMNAA